MSELGLAVDLELLDAGKGLHGEGGDGTEEDGARHACNARARTAGGWDARAMCDGCFVRARARGRRMGESILRDAAAPVASVSAAHPALGHIQAPHDIA